MANYNFKEDIVIGESGEATITQDLESMGAKFISDNKDYRYDILMETRRGKLKYEIKTDVYCTPIKDTGNMFIEFECRGKESGINVTEADWFVMYYQYLGEAWYIKTPDLLKLINENNFRVTEFSGDKGSNTKGYLIKRETVRDSFIVRTITK